MGSARAAAYDVSAQIPLRIYVTVDVEGDDPADPGVIDIEDLAASCPVDAQDELCNDIIRTTD